MNAERRIRSLTAERKRCMRAISKHLAKSLWVCMAKNCQDSQKIAPKCSIGPCETGSMCTLLISRPKKCIRTISYMPKTIKCCLQTFHKDQGRKIPSGATTLRRRRKTMYQISQPRSTTIPRRWKLNHMAPDSELSTTTDGRQSRTSSQGRR